MCVEESENFPDKLIDREAFVRQIGYRWYAKFHAQGKGFDCHLLGRIEQGRYITGTWYDDTDIGYHGAFQFMIDPSTGNFRGKWVGWSIKGFIKSGDMIWERERRAV